MRTTQAIRLEPDTVYPHEARGACPRQAIVPFQIQCVLFLAAAALILNSPADAATRYVNLDSTSPLPPYTSWATAAETIQDAIDAASAGDEVVVTNGIYHTGGRVVSGAISNRVAVTKPLTLRSLNGPEVTAIAGYRVPGAPLGLGDCAVRCVYLGDGAALVGFTLTNGATRFSHDSDGNGGGLWCASASALVSNCVIRSNSAYVLGGGAFQGSLANCIISGNSVDYGPGCGGGVYGSTLNNCALADNLATSGGGSDHGMLTNCILSGNSATDGFGGGASGGMLHNCTLTGNSARFSGDGGGGGVSMATLNHCTLLGNSGYPYGGGAYQSTLNNCILISNSVFFEGGGAYSAALNNCKLTDNKASYGGGACLGTLNNCLLTGNSSFWEGGGAYLTTLNNCTLTGNSAGSGGGVSGGRLNNCLVYYNLARQDGPNYYGGVLNYSCTTPLPSDGVGNIGAEPQLASARHLSAGSPCRASGSDAYASGVDIDGEAWLSPPSIGCDEFQPEAVTGPLGVVITASYTQVVHGVDDYLIAQIDGHASSSRWDFGDGTGVTNQPYVMHAWPWAGDYQVVLWAYNDSYPTGASAAITVHVVESPTHYVALSSTNPMSPYDSWATAATNIQDAVDAAWVAGALVLVSNGVYRTGARAVDGASNRVAVTKPLTLRSVNGPGVTVINGGGTVRCVYLAGGATLAGLTVTNGNAGNSAGGGMWCASSASTSSNCLFFGNLAGDGGGASGGTLNYCTFKANSAYCSSGGGAVGAILNNCTLTGNSAYDTGGGASGCTLSDCVIMGNTVHLDDHEDGVGGGGAALSTLNRCTLAGNMANYRGGGASQRTLTRCILTNNSAFEGGGTCRSALTSCSLKGNSAYGFGGGAAYGTLNNCTLMGNLASSGAGAFHGTLNNCLVLANSANFSAGGAYYGILNNCTLAGNSANAYGGGGAIGATLNNSILGCNTAVNGVGPNYIDSTLNYCCTSPLPTNGVGNFTNAPGFVDLAGGNVRLQSNSPCIDVGFNPFASGLMDLDGRPRIVGGTVDVGAYEFQGASTNEFIVWLQQFGLATDGSADGGDPDGDGLDNWQEWRAGTDPANALSVLRLKPPSLAGSNLVVTWESVPGRSYFLEGSTNLAAPPSFHTLAVHITGQAGTTIFTHTNAGGAGFRFYRVGVE